MRATYEGTKEERRRASKRAWAERNPEYQVGYRAAHREKQREYMRRWKAENRERFDAAVRAWRERNPEKVRGYVLASRLRRGPGPGHKRKYAGSAAERRVQISRTYYVKHKVRLRETKRRWVAKNRGRVVHYTVKRINRKRGNGGSHTYEQWVAKCALHMGCCYYCGLERKLTRDHKLPLSRGGNDDIGNVIPACQSCNSRKHSLTTAEFLAKRKAG